MTPGHGRSFSLTVLRSTPNEQPWADELARYFLDRLTVAGYDAVRQDRLDHDRINIVVGADASAMPGSLVAAAYDCVVWDAATVPLGYSPALRRDDVKRVEGSDLLFHGEITPHRARMIQGLRERGVPVLVAGGTTGDERDRLMRGAWAVLDLRTDERDRVLDPVHCFYPLANGVPVVAEAFDVEPQYADLADCLFVAETSELVERVARLHHVRHALSSEWAFKLAHFRQLDRTEAVRAAAEEALRRFA